MSGLKRIILIDTHLPGLVELKVDGHTNICGTNASGKTTLQRLVPVFYGESPNKVVPATRDNFQTWYLPRESSFIIFEYQRLDLTMCMAVLTSSSTGVVYRFVEKGFEVEDFITQDLASDEQTGNHSVPVTEMLRNMRRSNIVTSKTLNTKEYRSIIQNDRAVMALSSHKRDLLTASRYFSLCEPEAKLRHVEKLIKAVHSKEGKMETIKAMIAAILEEDGVETPSNRLSKAQVDDWIKECLLIKEFDQLMPQYKKLQGVNASLEQTESRLSQLKQQLSIDVSMLSESIVKGDSDYSVYKGQLVSLTTNFESQRDELNKTVSSAKAEVDTAEQYLDNIEDELNKWQDQDIETHQSNLENIPNWTSQLQSVIEQHALLTEEHMDIEAAYHKRQAEIEKKHSKELALLNSQKDDASAKLREKNKEENKALTTLVHTQERRANELRQDFDRQVNHAKLELQTVKTEIELSGPTAAEQQAMATQEASLEQVQLEEDTARQNLNKVQEALQQAKYQQIGFNEALNKTRSNVNTAQQKVDEIEAWLYPNENTLLKFLRTEHKGWENNIGKVINPALLSRTDLAPSLTESIDTQQSLYGIFVDTDTISETDIVQSEAQLTRQFDVANDDLKAVTNILKEAELALGEASNTVKTLEQKQTTAHSNYQFKQKARYRVQDERTQLKAEHKQALAERKLAQQSTLIVLQKNIDKLLLNQQQSIENDDDQRHEEKMEHELHWQQLIGDFEQKLTQLQQQEITIGQQYKEGLKACKSWYKDELANREVDVDQIAALKQTIAQLKEQIDVTNKHRDSVAQYARWYQVVFTQQKSAHLINLSSSKERKGKAERLLDEKTRSYKSDQKQLKQQITNLEKALHDQKELAAGIQSVTTQLTLLTLPKCDVVEEHPNPAPRLVETRELLQQQSQATRDITEYVNYFDNAIGQKSGISLTETWDHARRDCMVENAQGIQILDARKMVSELDTLLTVLVPQHLEGVRNNGLNFGNDLTQYYNILSDIDKRIVSQSRRISNAVDQELFLDGVSESSVRIRSRISEFDFWPKLIRFNKLHQAWLNDENSPLPDEEYTQTIREVQEVLGKATISGGISQLLDIELHLKEGNSDLYIRTDRQLNESSSHGMAYLILCKFLLAFTRLLRGDSKVIIHWPIDEIGTLANKNVKKIFDACKANQITVIGAFPNPESDVLHFFENRYLIDKDAKKQKLRMVQPKVNPISERLKLRQQTKGEL